jgi:DNA-directed RNA polymerase sigma subunit (sigma70/sigma32)
MQSSTESLLKEHHKLIESEAKRYATNIPLITVQIEAHKLARQAAESYNPATGKFSTHLVNSLKKLSRLGTQYGSTVRLPEDTQFGINRLNKAEKELESQFGRPPTIAELSDHTGYNIRMVNNLLQNRKSVVSFTNLLQTPTFINSANDEWLQFVYHDLSPKDKLIFEHKTGFGGTKTLSTDELCKKLNITTSQLNSRLKVISDMVGRGWK